MAQWMRWLAIEPRRPDYRSQHPNKPRVVPHPPKLRALEDRDRKIAAVSWLLAQLKTNKKETHKLQVQGETMLQRNKTEGDGGGQLSSIPTPSL